MFFSGCASGAGQATVAPIVEPPSWQKVPNAAVFFIGDTGIQAVGGGERLQLVQGATQAALVSDDHLVYITEEGVKQTIWNLDLQTGEKTLLFSLGTRIEQILPSPTGERFLLLGDKTVFGWTGASLQTISKGAEAYWSPSGSKLLIRQGNTVLVSDLRTDGSFADPVVIADGVGGPVAFVSETSVLFQKTLPAVEGEEGAEPRNVFTISTLQGATTDEFDALTPSNGRVLDVSDSTLLVFLPDTQETVVLSLENKQVILTIPKTDRMQFSTDGSTVLSVQDGVLYEQALPSGVAKTIAERAVQVIPTP